MTTQNEVQKACTGYEFTMGSVFAWRAFNVDAKGRLVGSAKHVWRPGENAATCRVEELMQQSPYVMSSLGSWGWSTSQSYSVTSNYDPLTGLSSPAVSAAPTKLPEPVESHPAPHESCTCGFYAFTDADSSDTGNATQVPAVIEAYGRVLIGSKGIRAEKARIAAITVDNKMWSHYDNIRRAYPNLPIFGKRKNMLREFPISAELVTLPTVEDLWGGV